MRNKRPYGHKSLTLSFLVILNRVHWFQHNNYRHRSLELLYLPLTEACLPLVHHLFTTCPPDHLYTWPLLDRFSFSAQQKKLTKNFKIVDKRTEFEDWSERRGLLRIGDLAGHCWVVGQWYGHYTVIWALQGCGTFSDMSIGWKIWASQGCGTCSDMGIGWMIWASQRCGTFSDMGIGWMDIAGMRDIQWYGHWMNGHRRDAGHSVIWALDEWTSQGWKQNDSENRAARMIVFWIEMCWGLLLIQRLHR